MSKAICTFVKENGQRCRNAAKPGTERCWRHQAQHSSPGIVAVNSDIQPILQMLCETGLNAANAGEYQKSLEWFSQVQQVIKLHLGPSQDLSMSEHELEQPKAGTGAYLTLEWEYLAILLGVIWAFLGALLEGVFTFILDLSRIWAAGVLVAFLVAAVVIIALAIRGPKSVTDLTGTG